MHQPIKIRVGQAQDFCGSLQREDLSVERDPDTIGSQTIALFIFLEVGDGFFKGEAVVVTHPVEGCWSINSSFSAGGCQRHFPSLPQDKDTIALTSGSSWYPLRIFRAIGAIGVNAVIFCPRKPSGFSIGQEVDETLRATPSLANLDWFAFRPSAVLFVTIGFRVVATSVHVKPRSINRRWITCVPMLEGKLFRSLTSTTRGVSVPQMGRRSDEFFPAKWMSTLASDNYLSVPIFSASPWSISENGKRPKLLSNDINELIHIWTYQSVNLQTTCPPLSTTRMWFPIATKSKRLFRNCSSNRVQISSSISCVCSTSRPIWDAIVRNKSQARRFSSSLDSSLRRPRSVLATMFAVLSFLFIPQVIRHRRIQL
jgi:hypothetical protein